MGTRMGCPLEPRRIVTVANNAMAKVITADRLLTSTRTQRMLKPDLQTPTEKKTVLEFVGIMLGEFRVRT
eukprot:12901367-Prorocentrum_lima.AAC.1